jgi:hypothetical protein
MGAFAMLKFAIVCAAAIFTLPAAAATALSPPIYPSFTKAPAKPGMAAPIYPSFNSPKTSASFTTTTFAPPGSVWTSPIAINNSGVIAGWYATAYNSTRSGFIREPDGTLVTFSAPGAGRDGATTVTGINSSGTVVGYYTGNTGHGDQSGSFIRAPDGTLTQFNIPGALYGAEATAINDQGYVAGIWDRKLNSQVVQPVFLRELNGYVEKIYVPFAEGSVWINSSGTMTSTYSGHTAFIRPMGGPIVKFHIGDLYTVPDGINAAGTIAGDYGYALPGAKTTASRAFVRSADGTIIKYRVPDATNTWPAGINDSGVIAGSYQGRAGNLAGFLRAPDGTITRFHLPYAKVSWVNGLNNSGMVIGQYNVSNNPQKMAGFVITP